MKMTMTIQNMKKFAAGVALFALVSTLLVSSVAQAATGDNLIKNPDVETASSGLPQYWRIKDNNSSNKVTFTYPVAGYNSAKAIKVQVTYYEGTGDEGWYFNDVPVTPGKTYTFTDKYISNAESSVRIRYKYSDGSTISPKPYLKVPAATDWTDYSTSFTVPTKVVSVTIFHMLKSVGVLTTDTFALQENIVGTPPPVISSFSASPTAINAGQISNLSWNVSGATSASINQGIGNVSFSGTVGVTPTTNTTYTLSAFGPGGTTTANVTVTINPIPAPTIPTFTATPSTIFTGATSTLAWTTTGATFVTINQAIGAVATNSTRVVSPTITTTYTISAGNSTGTTTKAVTVTVNKPPLPTIPTFTASPSTINSGTTSTLAWTTTNATFATINQGVGTVGVNNSRGVAPASTTTYILSAGNITGTTTKSVTVTVNPTVVPPPVPTINSFGATPSTITTGATSTLSWTTTGATFLTIDQGVGVVTANNSKGVAPSITTTYTLSAGNVTGTTTQAVTVTVNPPVIPPTPQPAPSIVYFNVDPTTVNAGAPANLSWEVTNASTTSIDQGIGIVVASSTRSVTVANTVTFTMTAVSPVGTTTKSVTLNVSTPPIPPPIVIPGNLILNPSFEIADATGIAPANWHTGGWGTNTTSFNYLSTGYEGTRSSEINMSAWTDGDAKWYFDDVAIGAGKQYLFSDHYKSTTDTWLTARYTSSTGVITYSDIASLPSSNGAWTQISKIVAPPLGTASMTIFHLINKMGTLATDSFSFVESDGTAPDAFDKGYVSLTIDDGWTNQYTAGLPILTASGLKASFFIISDEVQNADSQGPDHEYMDVAQMLDIQSKGHEVTSHTKTHPSLISLSAAAAQEEITGSRNALLGLGVTPVDTFAYPFGDQNANVVQYVKNAGYIGARGVEAGFNTKATNKYILQSQNVGVATTVDQVKAWVDAAAANKTWLILTFHLIDTSNDEYSVTPTNFQAMINYLKTKGISVITMKQGLQMMP